MRIAQLAPRPMACGTPVIAYRSSSMPKIVEAQAIKAVNELGRLDRRRMRARFEERFSAKRMAKEYESQYRTLSLP